MSRLVREVRTPADDGDSAYATPEGDIVRVPQDFAFADTIVALEEEIPTQPLSQRPPPSHRSARSERPRAMTGPPPPPRGGFVDEPVTTPSPVYAPQHAPQMMVDQHGAMTDPYGDPNIDPGQPPMMYGTPEQGFEQGYGHDPGLVTRSRSAFSRVRNNVTTAGEEMKQLWGATYDAQQDARLAKEEDPFVRLAGKLQRLKRMWSFFEWDQEDKLKAMWIGMAVFAFAVALAVLLTRSR